MGKTRRIRELFGLHDRTSAILALVAGLVLLLNWAAIIAFLAPRLGTLRFLRLHYTAALGVDWEAEWWKVFSFPILGCATFFINGFLSGMLARKHRMLGLTVLFATAVIEMALAGGGVMAIMLNS